MIGLDDIPKFLLAFFLVLPIISLLHETGHVFFAWLMGGKNIRVTIGSGKPVLRLGMMEIRKYYFWYGTCTFDDIKKKDKLSNSLIFLGGSAFNVLGIVAVALLVDQDILEPNVFTYQFTYFSVYYIFFALFPMLYPDGNYSDGKILLDLIKGDGNSVTLRTYRVRWHEKSKEWHVLDYKGDQLHTTENEEDAIKKARPLAEANRPSKITREYDGTETEIQNFPRIPL